jgi:hypothetical protein
MTVKELMKTLQNFDENMQVCLFVLEYEVYTPDILVVKATKEDDSGYPYDRREPLQDEFVSTVDS